MGAPVPASTHGADDETFEPTVAALIDAARKCQGVDKEIEAWRKVAQAAPQARLPRRELVRITRSAGRFNALAEALKELAERIPQDFIQEKIAVLLDLAAVFREQLKLDVMSISALHQVLVLDPGNIKATEQLETLYEQLKRWPDLVALLQKKAAGQESAVQVQLGLRVAAILADKLSNQAEATKAYEHVLEVDPANSSALEYLKETATRRHDWEKLLSITQREIETLSGEARLERRIELARFAAEKVKKREVVIACYRQILSECPTHLEALSELANLSAWEVLERHTFDRWEWAALFRVYEQQLQAASSTNDRAALLSNMAKLASDALDKPQEAIALWQRLLELRVDDATALEEVATLCEARERWSEAASYLERQQVLTTDPQKKLTLCERLGRLWGDRLGDDEAAERAWNALLLAQPNHLVALRSLAGIQRRKEAWEPLVLTLRRILESGREILSPPATVAILGELAWIHTERLARKSEAITALRELLTIDSSNREALDNLERLLMSEGRFEEAISVLERKVEAATSSLEQAEALLRLARLWREEGSEPHRAIECYAQALALDPTSEEASLAMEESYTQQGQFDRLVELLIQRLDHTGDPDKRVAILLRVASAYEQELNQPELAFVTLQAAFKEDAKNPLVVEALVRITQAAQKWNELLGETTQMVRELGRTEDAAWVWTQLGRWYAEQLGHVEYAVTSLGQALSIVPNHEGALETLALLYRREQRWKDLAEVLEKRGVHTSTGLLELADLYETRLGNTRRARELYEQVLTIDGDSLDALESLQRLVRKEDDWDELARLLERKSSVLQRQGESASEVATLLVELAELFETQLRRIDQAIQAYRDALAIEPEHRGALQALERLLEGTGQWAEYAQILQQQVGLAQTRDERLQRNLKLGILFQGQLAQDDQAILAFSAALADDPQNQRALRALAQLHEKHEQWNELASVLTTLAETASAPERVNLLYHVADLAGCRGDTAVAEAQYRRVLEADPRHTRAFEALFQLYRNQKEWPKLAELCLASANAAEETSEKARLLGHAAAVQDQLGNSDQARTLWSRVLSLDLQNSAAALALSDVYFSEQRWADLASVLKIVVAGKGELANDQWWEIYARLGRASEETGQEEEAIAYYRSALERRAATPEVLERLANLTYAKEQWESAFALYQQLLAQGGVRDANLVDIHTRLGQAKLRQGDHEQALAWLRKALERDANYRPALESCVEVFQATGDLERVLMAKQALLTMARNQTEQIDLWTQLGALSQKLGRADQATSYYASAQSLQPQSLGLLHKLLDLYTESKQWKKVVEVLLRVADLEPDPVHRGKVHYSAAVIYRDELVALDEAVEHFDKALALYMQTTEVISPESMAQYLKAFEAMDKILTSTKDWMGLQRVYRRMLKRMPASGHDVLRVNLWHNLGEIYRSRVKDYASAVEAFEAAAQIDPKNETRHQILAELYTLLGGEHRAKAAHALHLVIQQDPARLDAYHMLFRHYRDAKQDDRAWCIAQALVFLRKASPEQQQFLESYKGSARSRGRISDEIWVRHLYHPQQDRYVSAMLGLLSAIIYPLKAAEPKLLGLDPKTERRNLAEDSLLFSKMFRAAHGMLNLGPVELYAKKEQASGMVLAATKPHPAFVVGADLLQGRTDKELLFIAARQLAYLRPEHILRQIAQTGSALKVVLLSGIKAVEPNFSAPTTPEITKLIAQIQNHLASDPARAEQLTLIVRKFLQLPAKQRDEIDLGRWIKAVDVTVLRAALTVCGDLPLAARLVSLEPAPAGAMSAKDKVKELLTYWVSEDHLELRGHATKL